MKIKLLVLIIFVFSAVSNCQIIKKLKPDEGNITYVTFSHNGKYLAFGTTCMISNCDLIFLYETSQWKLETNFKGNQTDVTSLSFSPDGKYLLSTHKFRPNVLLWNISGNLKWNLGIESNTKYATFSSDGHNIVLNRIKSNISYWGKNYDWNAYCDILYYNIDNQTKKEYNLTKYHKEGEHGLKDPKNSESFSFYPFGLSRNNKFNLSDALNGEILLWNLDKSDNNIHTLSTKNELLETVIGMSPTENKAAVANYSKDNWIYLWDLDSKLSIKTFKGHKDHVTSLAFSPDGNYLVSASKDETIKIWDIKTGKVVNTLKNHQDNVNSVAFSLDGKYMASGSDDETIIIWDANELMPELKLFSAKYDLEYGIRKQIEEEKLQELATLNDAFNSKGEFETTEEYKARIAKANEDKKAIEEKYDQKLKDYIALKRTELEVLNIEKQQSDNEKANEIKSKIDNSIRDTTVNIAFVGTYNADKNLLPVTVKGKSGTITILKSEAKSLKENWKKTKAKAKMRLREDLTTYEYYDIIVIHPLSKNEYKLDY